MTSRGSVALLWGALVFGCSPAARSPEALTTPAGSSDSAPSRAAADASAAVQLARAAADGGADEPPTAAAAASSYAPCQSPPQGMVCIPGGPAVVGSDDGRARERPRHTVELSTFYIDGTEVTNAAYEACEKAGACPRRILPDPSFLEPRQPAVPVTWRGAHDYCAWVGKRLPTEAEWEKVARGGPAGLRYPWGDEPASCERAQTAGCPPNTTKPVGSLPPGAYGVYDMAGNGYEWVADWASACYQGCPGECGQACLGRDPLGPCAGATRCKGHSLRVLKGGSWRWAATEARGAWRRPEKPQSGAHRLSFRCASSRPLLSTWPPRVLSSPRPPLSAPEPPTAAELEAFGEVTEDDDVLKLKSCDVAGISRLDCRDPFTYITTNEPEQHVWLPYVQNLGGGYVGIGADQSYSFIAAARSRWAWIFDYDPTVVRLHYIIRAAVLSAETPAEFAALFSASGSDALERGMQKWLEPGRRDEARRALIGLREALAVEYQKRLQTPVKAEGFGWLRHAEHYRYIRLLLGQGRIQALKGNLLTDKAMPSIGRSAKALGVPVRIFYTSNADDQWELPRQFQQNVLALPFDEHSVALRTVYPRFKQRNRKLPWQYVVQWGPDLQERFRASGWSWVWYLHQNGHRAPDGLVVTVGLPGANESRR